MSDFALRVAIAAVCAWTKFYTWGLPFAQRAARCEEIESDLWESANDPAADRRLLPLHIVARLLIGMPDDLGWRSELLPAASPWRRRVALTMGVAMAMFGLWLVGQGQRSPELPELPESLRVSPHGVRLIDAPPPPPPPPPPCPPQGFPQPPGACTR
jgi:hypothetical protein